MNIIFIIYHIQLILQYFSVKVNSIEIVVYNEKDLIESSRISLYDELNIIINSTKIELTNDIIFDNPLEKLTVTGLSYNSSLIKFNNKSSGFVINNQIKNIEINNISIQGNLDINNYINVTIENVDFNGFMYYGPNFNKKTDFWDEEDYYEYVYNFKKRSIVIKNFTYHADYMIDNSRISCIIFHGVVNIYNSFFYGSNACTENLIYYDGESINDFHSLNSFYNGAYLITCLNIYDSYMSTIISSTFIRGASYTNGGYHI